MGGSKSKDFSSEEEVSVTTNTARAEIIKSKPRDIT